MRANERAWGLCARVCMCVCARERERERATEHVLCMGGDLLYILFIDLLIQVLPCWVHKQGVYAKVCMHARVCTYARTWVYIFGMEIQIRSLSLSRSLALSLSHTHTHTGVVVGRA